MNLRNIDVNLLMALESLLLEHSVSRAAERMYLTQPAMSHALQRLRVLLDDPVLVRTRNGMRPTEAALALLPTVRKVLSGIEGIFAQRRAFDPACLERVFTLACTDYGELALLGPLASRLHSLAPGLRIVSRPPLLDILAEELERGTIDLAFGFIDKMHLPPQICSAILLREPAVCLVRRDHTGVGDTVSLEQYLQLRHLAVLPWGDGSGIVDGWLATFRRQRHIAHSVSHFLSATFIVAHTDLVLTVPRGLGERFVRFGTFRLVETSAGFPHYESSMIWHPITGLSLAQSWLREQVLHVASRGAVNRQVAIPKFSERQKSLC